MELRKQREFDEKDDPYAEDPYKEEKYEEQWSDEEIEDKKEFKTYRRLMFFLGKFLKYSFWFVSAWFFYHYYQIVYKKDPEAEPFTNYYLMGSAFAVYEFYTLLRDLLTKPPVSSLLLERPPLPPGQMYPKTLVLNVSGTLVHSEYKVS